MSAKKTEKAPEGAFFPLQKTYFRLRPWMRGVRFAEAVGVRIAYLPSFFHLLIFFSYGQAETDVNDADNLSLLFTVMRTAL